MSRSSFLPVVLGLASASIAGAQTPSKSVTPLTVAATLTIGGTPTTTVSGTTTTVRQTSTSYKLGNREVLQLMAQENIIPSATGYVLVQKFDNDGTSLGYFAWNASTHSEVKASDSIFGFVPAGGVVTTNTVDKAGVLTGSVVSKIMGTITVDGASVGFLNAVTKTFGSTGKIGKDSYKFTSVTTKGTLIGTLAADGPAIEGTLTGAKPKPFLVP